MTVPLRAMNRRDNNITVTYQASHPHQRLVCPLAVRVSLRQDTLQDFEAPGESFLRLVVVSLGGNLKGTVVV